MIGSVKTLIGSKFTFRTEQAAVISLGYLNGMAATGSDTICNAAISAIAIAPSISNQPAGTTVTAGQTATFSVTATGTATLTSPRR